MALTITKDELTVENIYKSILEYCSDVENCANSIKAVFKSKLESEFWSRRTLYLDESIYIGNNGNVYLAAFDKMAQEDGNIYDVLEEFKNFEFNAEGKNTFYLSIGDDKKYKYYYAGTLKGEFREFIKNYPLHHKQELVKSLKERFLFQENCELLIASRLAKVCPNFIEIKPDFY